MQALRRAKAKIVTQSSWAVLLAAAVVVLAGLHLAREVLVPLALSFLLSFLLWPLVVQLNRWRVPRIPAVFMVAFLALSVLGSLGWLIVRQMGDLLHELPQHTRSIEEKIDDLRGHFSRPRKTVDDMLKRVEKAIDLQTDGSMEGPSATPVPAVSTDRSDPATLGAHPDSPVYVRAVEAPGSVVKQLLLFSGPFMAPFTKAAIVTVLVILMLIQGENLRNRLLRLVGRAQWSGATTALTDAGTRVSRYLLSHTLMNGSYGAGCALGLYLLDVPGWALWGFLCAVFRFLPYVGPWLGAVPPVLLVIVTSEGWTRPLETAALFVALELIINLGVEPWLYGNSAGVSPLAILFAAVFWTWMWGPIGLLLATPLTVCLVVMGKYIPRLSYLNVLLGDEEPLNPPEQVYQRLLTANVDEARKLIEKYTREQPFAEVFDTVLVPALTIARRDADVGAISDEKLSAIAEHLYEAVDSLPELRPPEQTDGTKPIEPVGVMLPRLVCVPANDEIDGVAASMLAHVCAREGFLAQVLPEQLLVSEIIEQVESIDPLAVCIVALPASAMRYAHALSLRLHNRLPKLKIVVLAWGMGPEVAKLKERLRTTAHTVTPTATETLAELKSLTPAPDQESHAVQEIAAPAGAAVARR